jgi:hypothetical protein
MVLRRFDHVRAHADRSDTLGLCGDVAPLILSCHGNAGLGSNVFWVN